MQVLKEPGKKATGHKWIWVMRGGPPGQAVVSFDRLPDYRSGGGWRECTFDVKILDAELHF